MLKSIVISVLLVCSFTCLSAQEKEGRLLGMDKETRVKDLYIIVFKDNTEELQEAFIESVNKNYSGKVLSRYTHSMQGVSVVLQDEFAREVSALPIVAFVEAVGTVKPASTSGIPWGTDRIDQRDLPLNDIYTPNARGTGVHAYIIDTGIRATHNEFTGRLGTGANFSGSPNGDCVNHGTYVAGILGGSSIGTADNVTLHDVKVFDCNGNTTENKLVDGIDWVAANFQSPAVANLSLAANYVSASINTAAQGLINAGVTIVVAAGNNNVNACNYSPAGVIDAITVANSDENGV